MNEFLKMDIFFFAATLGVVVLTLLAAYVLWRFARILKHIEYISKQVATESDLVRQDIAEMRSEIRQGKGRIKSLFSFLKKTTKHETKES
jgi:O-antigen/teichoic acid export membrane protein